MQPARRFSIQMPPMDADKTSTGPFLQINWNNNHITVPSFILSGAPFPIWN